MMELHENDTKAVTSILSTTIGVAVPHNNNNNKYYHQIQIYTLYKCFFLICLGVILPMISFRSHQNKFLIRMTFDERNNNMSYITPTNISNLNSTTNTANSTNTNTNTAKTIHQEDPIPLENEKEKEEQKQKEQQKMTRRMIYRYWKNHKELLEPNETSVNQRCFIQYPQIPQGCFCSDPTIPTDRQNDKKWFIHHKNLVQDARNMAQRMMNSSSSSSSSLLSSPSSTTSSSLSLSSRTKAIKQNYPLDFVMVGDSITERWNGTKGLGTVRIPGMRQVYEKKFTKAGGGRLEGLTLGSAGDTARNLLWHLDNGLLKQSFSTTSVSSSSSLLRNSSSSSLLQYNIPGLFPKVWLIVIGTNDLFIDQCTDSFALASILNVVKRIQEERPEAQLIVHGILPRIDPYQQQQQQNGQKTFYLGRYWERAKGINAQLEELCKGNEQTNLHYMDSGTLFLKQQQKQETGNNSNSRSGGGSGSSMRRSMETGDGYNIMTQIDESLMDDGVHPTIKGLEIWGDYIEEFITSLLSSINQMNE